MDQRKRECSAGERAKQRQSFRSRARTLVLKLISKPRSCSSALTALTGVALVAIAQLWHTMPYARRPPLLRAANGGGWRHHRNEDLARARGRAAFDTWAEIFFVLRLPGSARRRLRQRAGQRRPPSYRG